jgi:hypothetical protein
MVGSPSPIHPHGSERIARWAGARRLGYAWRPDEAWFRRWEPHDTLTAATLFYNSCTANAGRSSVVLVEPWLAAEDMEPLDRTVLAFASHPGLYRRAAMRVGEHFLTRVAFLESPPPPTVTIGEKVWDQHVKTFAASSLEASAAFHPKVRRLLAGWGFAGHIELRPGGLVVHQAGLRPTPEHYERLWKTTVDVLNAAIAYPTL